MWKWLKRFWTAGDAAVRIHAVYTLLGIIATTFAALVVAMSVIANWVTDLHSTYGLGAVIFVGIGAACVIVLVISAALVAWRLFNPLPKAKTDEDVALTAIPGSAQSKPWKADIESLGSLLEKYVDATWGNLKNDIASLAEALKATPWKAETDRLDKIGVAQHGVNEGFRNQLKELQSTIKTLVERLSTHERVVVSGTHLLIRGIRARDDRRFILIPNDEIAMLLGKRLVEAKVADYPDAGSWLSDYQTWEAAARTIDNLLLDWTKDAPNMYPSLFKLERRHFANSPMPPDNIKSDDTIIHYKTVWHAQPSYANQRDGIFAFFDERAVLPS